MTFSRLINLLCIIIGGGIAIYAKAEVKQDTYLLMGGIILLMFGLYRISRNIPSKYEREQDETFIETEDENEDR